MLRTALATAAVVGSVLAAAASAPAQAPVSQTVTFKEVNRGAGFNFVDNPPRAPHRNGLPTRVSPGDFFVVSNPLRDSAGKPFGRLRATCFITRSAPANALHGDCIGVFSLPTGQLWGSGTTGPGTTTGVIVAGTGAFANMHGTFISKSTRTGADDTVTLVAGQ